MYDNLKYKEIKRKVGIYKDTLLVTNIEIQNNHVKMSFKKFYNISIKENIKRFNLLSYNNKIMLANDGQCDNKTDVEALITDKVREIIMNSKEKEEFYEEEESLSNVNLYTGEAMPIIIWMCSFANKRLDKSIVDIIPTIVNKLLQFKEPSLISGASKDTNEEYYLYVGDSEKFKFCVGKQTVSNFERNNKSNQLLIEFEGKGDSPKKPCRFWCLEKNLIKIEL